MDAPDKGLLSAQAAAILKVHPHTVARWAREGKIKHVQRTLGGHRRYDEPEIRGLADALKAVA